MGISLISRCLLSFDVYVFQLLGKGYGFKMDDHITATDVISGPNPGWALGAMMYEINTLRC